jgi:hypothetical protein
MNADIETYIRHLQRELDEVCAAIDGLDALTLAWRPVMPDSNAISALVTHLVGNVRAWVLGVCCRQPIRRDRAGEFRAEPSTVEDLIERIHAVRHAARLALTQLDPATLDRPRELRADLTSRRPNEPVTGRQAIVHSIAHTAEHRGQIELTRDLARVAAGAT